jgi:hypothetical protein
MKNCLTCKYEPDWDSTGYGNCKRLPDFMNDACLKKFHDGSINFVTESLGEVSIVKDCTLWKGK